VRRSSCTSGATAPPTPTPCTLAPGTIFSAAVSPTIALQAGFHYIRLTVRNDIIRDEVNTETCGVIGRDIPSFDFVELEIEARDDASQ
jgi:hypothetical protein